MLLDNFVGSYSGLTERHSLFLGKKVKRWVLMLPGAGCEYWKRSGGCVMCGFNNSTQKYTHGLLLPDFLFVLLYKMAEKRAIPASPEEISIFNGGSFLNDNEIPQNFQRFVFSRISQQPLIKKIMIESRCEYISEKKIGAAMELLGDKKLTVGIGLESQNDFVRNKIIKKGLSQKMFEQTVKMLKRQGARVQAYAFLKPPGLNDEEAYADTIATIEYALASGVDEVDVSCAFIQKNTALEKAFLEQTFVPPSLKIILRIIAEVVAKKMPVTIGGFDDEPPPIAIPSSCPKCSAHIYEAIEQFRQMRVLGSFPDCAC